MLERSRRLPASRVCVAFVALVALVVGCGSDDDARSSSTPSGTVRVFAASSLTDAFAEMGTAFEAGHPSVQVTFNFAASSALAQQINEGGPADVFVAADESTMRKVTDAANAFDPTTIARNRLAILVEKGNPKDITGLADLAKSGVLVVLCAPEVPCGQLGAAALRKAGVTVKPTSLEENVKAVASRVILGEADAGIVYVTDVKAAGNRAQGVDIDIADDPDLQAVYPMAATRTGAADKAVTAWIDYVLSDEGRDVLANHGFLTP